MNLNRFKLSSDVVLIGMASTIFPLWSVAAAAQNSDPVDEIVVVGETVQPLSLGESSSSASRLGLELMETPASVDLIDANVMRARGYQRLAEAVQVLPGIVSGESPAAPSGLSMRGFSRSQITILRDGIWLGPTNMVMRPQNTFNLERVEVLRGPASVLHGQGVVAGTVNTVTRTATAGMESSADLLASWGRFDSAQLGVGMGGEVADNIWARGDISYRSSSGYVEDMDPESLNATASVLWQLGDRLTLSASVDYLNDELANYWGAPLVPVSEARDPLTDVVTTASGETLDGATRGLNYNVSDQRAESDQLLVRADLAWQVSDQLNVESTFYKFDADREWLNAEGYVYCTAVVDVCTSLGEVQRYYGYFFVFHDQDLVGNRTTLKLDNDLFGRRNTFVAGFEVTDLDFERARGFRRAEPQVPADAVDLYSPVASTYGAEELRGISPTTIETRAVFFEDALEISPRFSLVTALRYDELDLNRENFDADGNPEASGFQRDFGWTSYRLGGVYKFTEDFVAYAQLSNATDPVNANIFLVNAGENFDLTDVEQVEIGLKRQFGGAEATLAYYQIERDDVLEQIGVDSATNVGGRSSQGIEIAAAGDLAPNWRLGANFAWTDAEFDPSPNFINFAGNTPPNVPEWTANLWTAYRNVGGTRWEIGGAIRYIDERFGDNANTVRLSDYTIVDTFAAYNAEQYRLTARVNNVFDTDYVPWSDVFYLQQNDPGFIYANQLILGSPRMWELAIEYNF